MGDKILSDKLIESRVADFLPNKVLFALGDYDEVRCASIWIKQLEQENIQLKQQLQVACDLLEMANIMNDPQVNEFLEQIKTIKQRG